MVHWLNNKNLNQHIHHKGEKMLKNLKSAIILTGIVFSLGSSAIAASYSTFTNSLGTSGYALDLRITVGALWTNNNGVSNYRYGNDNFTSSGNLLAGTQGGGIYEINAATGATVNSRTGLNNSYSFAQSGDYLYAPNVDGNIDRWNTSDNFGSDAPTPITTGGYRSIYADPSGNTLYAVNSSAATQVIKYDVDGSGNLTTNFVTSGLSSQLRGITYVDGRGLYAAKSGGFGLFHVSDGNVVNEVLFGGVAIPGLASESIAFANISGFDYLFLNASLGGQNGVMVAELGADTNITAWDFYSGGTIWGSNDGLQSAWATGGVANGNLYYGNGSQIRAFELSAVTPIPEPSTYAMLALGLAMSAYGLRASRRKKQVAQKA